MSTTVSYKGATIATVSNQTKTLLTEGKYLEDDLTLVDVSGGGSTLITKAITNNGTYNASSDSADGYSQVNVSVPASAVDSGTKSITANGNNQDVVGYAAVNVNVPNSYSAGDEGKVVSSGALVAQTSDTVTANDTYDTTLINSLTVNVSGGGGGLTADVKVALLDCFAHVAWVDEDGQDYYDALEEVLYPPADLVSISASFDSGGVTIWNTDSLDDLKQYLTVTALYADLTTEEVNNYILTGSMAAGTQTITVTYAGKTTNFSVTIGEWVTSVSAVYTQGGTVYDTDNLNDLKNDLVVTATFADTTSETLSDDDYTLSGTLATGTSTITVAYGGKTTTFSVNVTHYVQALYPLPNGTYQISESRLLEISNGNHIKFSVTSDFSVSGGTFLNLNTQSMGSNANVVNNKSVWFTIPANEEAVFSLDNVVNTGEYPFTMNFRKALATSSGSFGTGKSAHTSGTTITQTLQAAEDEGCLFMYFDTTPIPANTVLEFDVSLMVGDDKYI